jgi:hypothetical protein
MVAGVDAILPRTIILNAHGSIDKLQRPTYESRNLMTPVVNSAPLIALSLGCVLVAQSVVPLAVFGASEARDLSVAKEAADILGVRSNVDRILALQAAGHAPSEELLWNKAIVLKQLLLGYLEVRQTSDLLDEAIDDTYDAIDKQVRSVNRRVQLANIANFTAFGVLFNIAAADRLRKKFRRSTALTFISASLSAGIGAVAVGLSYTGASIDRCRPNPLADVFGSDKVSVPLPELVSKYINATPNGNTKSRKAAMLDLWKTEFGVNESSASQQILAAESPKRHYASLHLLNQRLALLFSLNALAEQFDTELLALLRRIESTSVPTINGSTLAANSLGAPGFEAAKLLQVEQYAANIINMNRTGARNGADLQTLALDLYMLEKILGGALEVRQVVDRIDQEKHYQFDILLPQLVRVRDRVDLLNNTATFTEIGVLKNIAAGDFYRKSNQAGLTTLMTMDAIAVLLSTANLAYQRFYRHKQDSQVNVLANVFKFDTPSQYHFSSLISSYLEGVPPGSANGITRKQQLLDHWKQTGRLPKNRRTAEALASLPSMHDKRVETIELVNKRVQMLFDVRGTVETLDSGLLQLLTAVILPTPEKLADNRVDKQLALIKRIMQNALEVRSASDQIDNQLSQEYTAKEAILAARSRGIQYNNILNFTQSGTLGVVAQCLALDKRPKQAETLNLISGSAVLLLSSAALLQQRIGRRPSEPELNVLAQVLVPGATTNECIPASVLQHLNSPALANGLTRRESLIERWRKSGVITTSLRSERNLHKLCASAQTSKKESVQLITDRIVMLHDMKTTIESMDKQLVRTLREEGQ